MNKWDKKFTVTFTIEVESANFPKSKLSGDIEDQICDLTKDFAFNALDCGSFEITISKRK